MDCEEMSFVSGDSLFDSDSLSLIDEDRESGYGESFVGQRLIFDFTPNDSDVDEELLTKCCNFWEFVTNQPELNLQREYKSFKESESVEESIKTSSSSSAVREKTAVSMFKLVEQKGMSKGAFVPKLPNPNCEGEMSEYMNKPSIIELGKSVNKISKGAKKAGNWKYAPGTARTVCEKLEKWDCVHPKCMDPPGPVPDIIDGK